MNSNKKNSLTIIFLSFTFQLSLFTLTGTLSKLEAKEENYCIKSQVMPLAGTLDNVPVFNSNSPELVLEEGILLSTFPKEGMLHPEAHLSFSFNGRFDIFSHHITKADSDTDKRVLWLNFLAMNPTNRKIKIQTLCGASYLSQPEAPFIQLPEFLTNNNGKIFSGPGDRAAYDILSKSLAPFLPKSIMLNPGQCKLFLSLAIPVRKLRPALNGRSSIFRMKSNGPIYIASLAKYNDSETEAPKEEEILDFLAKANLAKPRDKAPTPLDTTEHIIYGRVAGVSLGSSWNATITNLNNGNIEKHLNIPEEGQSLSFPLSSLRGGSFGTNQTQSAKILARYPDTAYDANGNYGIEYNLTFPLINPFKTKKKIQICFQSAIKENIDNSKLCFLKENSKRIFFRGSVILDNSKEKNCYHLVTTHGSQGAILSEFTMQAGSRQNVSIRLVYPADATPPQEITIRTLTQEELDTPKEISPENF